MLWRRVIGAIMMFAGAVTAVAMVALCAIVIANFLEWDSAADALGTIAAVAFPAVIVGVVLLALGRWAYGDFDESAPVTHASAVAVRAAGYLIALGLGGALVFLLVTGVGPDDQAAAIVLAIGAVLGVAMIFLALRIRPINRRSYLDE